MDTSLPLLPALPSRPLIQPDDHGPGWWAFAVVHHRVVAAWLLPDAESARLVAHEIQAALDTLWSPPRASRVGRRTSSASRGPTAPGRREP